MRTLAISLAVIAVLSCVNLAQDVPPEPKKIDTADLLSRYLTAEGKLKAALRGELLNLPTEKLQAAIAAHAYTKPENTGTLLFTTDCPDGYERPYWVYVPEGHDATKRYPLMVCLHGGVSGTPLYGGEDQPAPGQWSLEYWTDNLPKGWENELIVLGCSAGARETTPEAVWWHTTGQNNINHFIREVKRQINIDDDRVFLNGHSDGGSGSFAMAYRMPNAFAGYFSMNGHPLVATADETPVWLENLKGQNLYAFNGGKDGLYPANRVTPMYEQANELGASIDYTVFPELNHGVADVLEDEVAKFLEGPGTSWKRNLLPGSVDWTCTSAERGSRDWISIDELADLGSRNAAPENAEINVPGARVRLGINVRRDVDEPTVEDVVAESTAEKMGMKEGDVIKKLDDHEIATLEDLIEALGTKEMGDDVVVVVNRDGEELELKGNFPKREQEEVEGPLTARVIAELVKPGQVDVQVRNAGKISIWVAPSMLDAEGQLRVRLNPGSEGLAIVISETFTPDNELILDLFEKHADRKLPWIGRFEIDVAKLLDVKVKPATPDGEEDEF